MNDTNLSRTDASVDELERYADPDRPPAHWVYPLAGVLIGAAIAVPWILPGPLGLTMLVLAAGAGVGFDVWLSRRFGLPRLWQLPPQVRQGQLVLIAGIPVVVLAPFILAWALPWVSVEVGAVVAGIAVAVVLGVGGPITDRRARANAREVLQRMR